MKTHLGSFLKKIWFDPVLGRIIGSLLLTQTFFAWVTTSNTQTFWQQLFHFWTLPIVWVVCLGLIIYYILHVRKIRQGSKASTRVLFDSSKADETFFYGYPQFRYEDDKPVGDKADGSDSFKSGVLEINRKNKDGRYVVQLVKFSINGDTNRYIKSDTGRSGKRIFRISFQAKISDGSHLITFIAKKLGEDRWLNNAFAKQEISSVAFKEYNLRFRVNQDVDIDLYFHDSDVTKAPSVIQIKNLVIREDI